MVPRLWPYHPMIKRDSEAVFRRRMFSYRERGRRSNSGPRWPTLCMLYVVRLQSRFIHASVYPHPLIRSFTTPLIHLCQVLVCERTLSIANTRPSFVEALICKNDLNIVLILHRGGLFLIRPWLEAWICRNPFSVKMFLVNVTWLKSDHLSL